MTPNPPSEFNPRVQLHGRLSADSIERSGLFLLADDGTRAELLLPRDWRRSSGPSRVYDQFGDVIADVGDEVTLQGAFTSSVASFRQIGRMFAVERMVREPAAPEV